MHAHDGEIHAVLLFHLAANPVKIIVILAGTLSLRRTVGDKNYIFVIALPVKFLRI